MKKQTSMPVNSDNPAENPKKSAKNRPIPDSYLSTPVFRLLAMLSVAMTAWVAAHIVMPYSECLLLLIFPLTAVGYGLQMLFEWLIPAKNPDKVSFIRGIPALLPAAILCLSISSPIYDQLANELLPNLYFESDYSSWTVFTVGFIFLVLLTSIYTAMIPPARFFSYNSVYSMGAVYLILWLLSFFAPSFRVIYLMIPAILITVFYLFALNQSGIDALSGRRRAMGVTRDLRVQNIRLTALMLLLLAGIFFLALVVFTGIYYTVKTIGLILLHAILAGNADSSEKVVAQTSDFFSGGLFELPAINRFLFLNFVIFAVIFIALLFLRIYNYRSGIRFRDLPSRLMELIRRLLAFLERLFKYRKVPLPRYAERQPYRDTVAVAVPTAYRFAARSYDDYLRRMREISDPNERFCFAYGTLMAGWRRLDPRKPNALSPALTPREICDKLAEEGRYNFEQITELHELIRYAEQPAFDENLPILTERLSGYVEQYFNTL